MQKRLLSGIKPTGEIHIGNYFGAMRQFLELQDEYESFIFIADYHAFNQIQDPKELKANILEIAKAYLAIGLNPEKVLLFKQSDVSAVTELAWIFNCITPMAELERAHAYKDAKAKGKPINMGLFTYPILMAADILLYKSEVVPVGQDQKQHLEMAQDMAKKFNRLFGNTFKIPQELILKDAAVIPGLDGQKMSKSYKNTIGLFDEPRIVIKKTRSIKTDSRGASEPKDPATCNVFALHRLFSNKEEIKKLEGRYRNGKISYQESKDMLAERINDFLAPIRTKKAELDMNPAYVTDILEQGQIKANALAIKTLAEIKEKIGIS